MRTKTVIKREITDNVLRGYISYENTNRGRLGKLSALRADHDTDNTDLVIDMIKEALQWLKNNNCDYAVGATRNPLMAISFIDAAQVRVFQDGVEITDLKSFKDDMRSQVKQDTSLCKVDADKALKSPVLVSYSLDGEALPPFYYLEFNRTGDVIKIHESEPNGSFIVSRHFIPGDENLYNIKVIDSGATQSLRR